MGEIADAIINGELDYETGEYIGSPVGYPRRAIDHNPVAGVTKFLIKYGYDTKAKRMGVIMEYCKGVFQPQHLPHTDKWTMCMAISDNWGDFVKWFKSYRSK